jgi:formylglycine-generating enzyme required for sulfatase activity
VLDCGNGVKLELVKVAAGSFNMGSNEYDSEKPIHRVNLREFMISKYPVTQAQYQAVIGKNPSHFKGNQNPVEKVSWHDAVKFCEKLAQKTREKVRLPTEVEWEYAAKGGNQSEGYKYAGSDSLDEVGWYDGNTTFLGFFGGKTQPVEQKRENELGIYDMSGNVWEWCEDIWHGNYNGAPTDGSAWLTGGEQSKRALRGGSWFLSVSSCRSANRLRHSADYCSSSIGFRVVV